ncbi:hypothetical protein IID04_01900 [PVC group bacterium]|nr:hypothetical protein [PVC group bacterium]
MTFDNIVEDESAQSLENLEEKVKLKESEIGGLETQAEILEKEISNIYDGKTEDLSEEDRMVLEKKKQLLRDIQQKIRVLSQEMDLIKADLNEIQVKNLRTKLNDLMGRRDKVKNVLILDAEKEIDRLNEEASTLDRKIMEMASQLSNLQK